MNKGLPIVISAPSGCGKDTILEQLYKKTQISHSRFPLPQEQCVRAKLTE